MEVSALTHTGSVPRLHGPSALLRLQSDERLIALTRRGQHAAFETLCSRYQTRLLSFCRHMLASREDAEDVLQEVFAAAFNAVLADEREINVRPWLYRIARNRSLNHLRRASAVGVDSMDIHFADHGLSTGDRVIKRESFRELLADVHGLPETQRTALLLREIEALSYEQIADAMETTVPSVKSLLVRARISLAEAAEARKLSCEDVRLELGEVAEGLTKLSTPARRHVRSCERCTFFKKQLKENNHALAAILPIGPLWVLRKMLSAKLGSTASAGGAHVAGAGGASVGAGAGASAGAGATIGAGAAGGTGVAGGLLTAGAGAIATKAVAGLAAAAIVTAGAVAAEHTGVRHHHSAPAAAYAAVHTPGYAPAPLVVHESAQPASQGAPARAALASAHSVPAKKPSPAAKAVATATSATSATSTVPAVATAPAVTVAATKTAGPQPSTPTQVTEVTSEADQLPAAATAAPAEPETPPATTTSTAQPATPTTPVAPPSESAPPTSGETETPTTPASPPPSGQGETGGTGGTPAPQG